MPQRDRPITQREVEARGRRQPALQTDPAERRPGPTSLGSHEDAVRRGRAEIDALGMRILLQLRAEQPTAVLTEPLIAEVRRRVRAALRESFPIVRP